MPFFVELTEFPGRARELLEGVGGGGEPVVVVRDGVPFAVVAAPVSGGGLLGGLPRWEEWLHEMRESFSNGGSQAAPPRPFFPEPPALDKALLGFDPSTGWVGSDAGREYLASELSRLGVPVRDEKLLAEVYSAVLA